MEKPCTSLEPANATQSVPSSTVIASGSEPATIQVSFGGSQASTSGFH